MFEPVAAPVQPLLDAVAAIVGGDIVHGQQQQHAGNACRQDGLHGLLLRRKNSCKEDNTGSRSG
jgi:hypothetical protein